jgi:dihydrofolate reductase
MKAIAAMAKNRVIGVSGRIPWHLPEDFRWFKKMTLGGTVVMGRKTFESLRKPLPNRRNMVLSRTASFPGVEVIRDIAALDPALLAAPDTWIIGGSDVYAQTLPLCSDLYLSLVEGDFEGDAYFPPFEHGFVCLGTVEKHADFSVLHYQNLRKGL